MCGETLRRRSGARPARGIPGIVSVQRARTHTFSDLSLELLGRIAERQCHREVRLLFSALFPAPRLALDQTGKSSVLLRQSQHVLPDLFGELALLVALLIELGSTRPHRLKCTRPNRRGDGDGLAGDPPPWVIVPPRSALGL